MRICVAQTKPIKGDIRANIDHHKKVIDLAVSHGADTVIFPELSLTGYELELAKELATHPEDLCWLRASSKQGTNSDKTSSQHMILFDIIIGHVLNLKW